ncbi:MAG: 2,3-bisphosphoglycerate-independent phosphoglycerate mutase [Candidatus Bathyarchaeota archaeon]|nr:2,3-bisphosphoglycerate-independent phosphoglycerate mutase [Candidatus Bathyarchaeota archaeon]MDW8039811.1 2,3-bisphosphoglycerate-independent phosphoglycerate mutase [Nitrososphaerota archaeon]
MKALLIIGDGMADRPLKELGWKTPLEAANKPSMDHLASMGVCGIMDPIAPGTPPGSDTATLALLGYDVFKVYSGRGAFEALGWGVEVAEGDVCFRCNFATVDENLTVLDRRAGRISNVDASKLAESLKKVKAPREDLEFFFTNTVQHRAVLILRGPKLSAAVSDSDPETNGEKIKEIKPLENTPEAKLTAEVLNALSQKFREVLDGHPVNKERVACGQPPANFVLFRGAGTLPKIKPLSELYGIKASCVAATSLIRGVCRAAGMQLLEAKGATGTPETNYMAKAKAAVQALENNDFVLLHVKAPDVSSHDGNFKQKVEVIEKIDKMLAYILNKVDLGETYLALTADHTTSCITGKHEGDPVPLAIMGPHVRSDDVKEFNERACAKGGLGRLRGKHLMPILMNFLDKVKKFGA